MEDVRRAAIQLHNHVLFIELFQANQARTIGEDKELGNGLETRHATFDAFLQLLQMIRVLSEPVHTQESNGE